MKEKGLVRKQISFFLLFTFVFAYQLSTCTASAESVIRSATYTEQSAKSGVVRLEVDGQVLPVVSLLGGDSPRLILDFPETKYLTQNTIKVSEDGPVESLRFGLHQAPLKTRVVVDLNPECTLTSPDVIVDGQLLDVRIECATSKKEVLKSSAVDQVLVKTVALGKPAVSEEISIFEKSVPPTVVDPASPSQSTSQPIADHFSLPPTEQGKTGMVEKETALLLHGIVYDSTVDQGEKVLFYLNDFLPPVVFAEENNGLLVYCDFHDVEMAETVMAEMLPEGAFIQKISTSTETNPNKVRVELELSPDHDYDLQQIFYRKDNVFTLVVNVETPVETITQE